MYHLTPTIYNIYSLAYFYEYVSDSEMPRKYKRPPGTRPYVPVDEEMLKKAVEMCSTGKLSLRQAAEEFGVDKMKIFRKLKGLKQNPYGGRKVFTDVEEALLRGRYRYLTFSSSFIYL